MSRRAAMIMVKKNNALLEIPDVAVKIVNDYTQLTSDKRFLRDLLLVLAEKSHAFREKTPPIQLRIIKSIIAVFGVKVGHAETESDSMHLLRIIWEKVAILPNNEIDLIIQGPPLEIEEG